MKRFNFRLEKLLEVRSYEESKAEAELAKRSGAVALLEKSLMENAEASIRAGRERFRKGGGAQDYRAGERYALRLAQERDRLMKALAQAEFERDKARQLYVEASRAKELIGKLKERAETGYYKSAAREEMKLLDDMASIAKLRTTKQQRES